MTMVGNTMNIIHIDFDMNKLPYVAYYIYVKGAICAVCLFTYVERFFSSVPWKYNSDALQQAERLGAIKWTKKVQRRMAKMGGSANRMKS